MNIRGKGMLPIILLLAICFGCWSLSGPGNALSKYIPVTDSLDVEQLTGLWKATAGTYGTLEHLDYKDIDPISIELKSDLSLVFNGMPNLLPVDNWNDSLRSQSVETGNWKIERSIQFQDEFVLAVSLNRSALIPNGMSSVFWLYRKENIVTILTYIDDPDLGRILTFTKDQSDNK